MFAQGHPTTFAPELGQPERPTRHATPVVDTWIPFLPPLLPDANQLGLTRPVVDRDVEGRSVPMFVRRVHDLEELAPCAAIWHKGRRGARLEPDQGIGAQRWMSAQGRNRMKKIEVGDRGGFIKWDSDFGVQ